MLAGLSSPAWLLILGMVGLGKLYRERGALPDNAADTLNRYVIYVALPALVLLNVQALNIDPDLAWLAAAPWLLLLASCSVVLALARAFGWSRNVTGALLLCVPLGNTAYLGYPLVSAMIGPEAAPLAVVYDQLGTFLILSSFGVIVTTAHREGRAPGIRRILSGILRFPPFIALLVALLPIPWPDHLLEVARMLAVTLVPVACLAVGLQLRIRLPRKLIAPFATGLVLKLIALPLGTLLILRFAGVERDVQEVGVLLSAMPSMITAGAIATAAGMDSDLCAGLVGLGILASFITAPAMLALV